ncbi:MAG: hypothetical protein H9893_09130 [Candidatus Niameybacter stercoravium]|nr:hypothetical protein [Candidatus Niameybacter stercoravium]
MRVSCECIQGKLKINLYPEENEYEGKKARLSQTSCEFQLPTDWDLTKVHPDVLATAIILMVYPFAKKTLELPIGVSSYFSEICKKLIKKDVGPVDERLEPRVSKESYRMALAYSGGVDSTAAAIIMPKDSVLFFVDRIIPEGVTTAYRKEAAYFACESLRQKGHKVYQVATNFEYIREPVGFPVDLACSIPALLMADYEGIDSIAVGMIIDTAYGTRRYDSYRDYLHSWHYKVWGGLLASVDIPVSLVTAGLSEVATSLIVQRSGYSGIAESCMRGKVGKPCMKCMKCFRKKLIEEILDKGCLSEEIVRDMLAIEQIKGYILEELQRDQYNLLYITNHYSGEHKLMKILKNTIGGDRFDSKWLEKWYSPSIELIKPKYRAFIQGKINEYVINMTQEEIVQVEGDYLKEFLESSAYQEGYKQLEAIVSSS